jgi:PAS domain S-box-containing protein
MINILKKFFSENYRKTEVYDFLEVIKNDLDLNNLNIRKELILLEDHFKYIPCLLATITYNGEIIKFNDNFNYNTLVKSKGDYILDLLIEDELYKFSFFLKNLKEDSNSNIVTKFINKNYETVYINWKGIDMKNHQLILLYGQDVTKEVFEITTLRNSLKSYKLIVDNYIDPTLICDTDGKIKLHNKKFEKLSNYKNEDLYKTHIYDIFKEKYFLKDLPKNIDLNLITPEGSIKNISVSVNEFKDNDEIIGYIIKIN